MKHKVGTILDGIHYRTSRDWGELLGYSQQGLKEMVIHGVEFYKDLARQHETAHSPMPVSGVVGPRGDAITAVDQSPQNGPAYYMINCTLPVEFASAFEDPGPWINRVCGLRPDASSLAHGMLCQLGHLEEGNPDELAEQMADMANQFPHINVWGGGCGTDYAHINKIASAVLRTRSTTRSAA